MIVIRNEAALDGSADIEQCGDTLSIMITHPLFNTIKRIEFNQESVRGSDGIRVSYDFDRDGFVIEQPYDTFTVTKYTDRSFSTNLVINWKEVGFFKAWALQDEHAEEQALKAYEEGLKNERG